MKKAVCIAAAILALSGCNNRDDIELLNQRITTLQNEVTTLRSSLGDFQYRTIDPKFEVILSGVQFKPSNRGYGIPIVSYQVNIKQTNPELEISSYSIGASYVIENTDGATLDDGYITGTVHNGVVAIANESTMYGFKGTSIEGLSMRITNIEWWPSIKFKPTTLSL